MDLKHKRLWMLGEKLKTIYKSRALNPLMIPLVLIALGVLSSQTNSAHAVMAPEHTFNDVGLRNHLSFKGLSYRVEELKGLIQDVEFAPPQVFKNMGLETVPVACYQLINQVEAESVKTKIYEACFRNLNHEPKSFEGLKGAFLAYLDHQFEIHVGSSQLPFHAQTREFFMKVYTLLLEKVWFETIDPSEPEILKDWYDDFMSGNAYLKSELPDDLVRWDIFVLAFETYQQRKSVDHPSLDELYRQVSPFLYNYYMTEGPSDENNFVNAGRARSTGDIFGIRAIKEGCGLILEGKASKTP